MAASDIPELFDVIGALFTVCGLFSWLVGILLQDREYRKLAVKKFGRAATATGERIKTVKDTGEGGGEWKVATYSYFDGGERKEISRRAESGPFPQELKVWISKDRVVFDIDILEQQEIEARPKWPLIMLLGGLLLIAIGLLADTLA